jgi:Protein of unknown function (DUF2911)
MKNVKQILTIALLATANLATNAQLKLPAPSPSQTVKQAFGLSEVTVEYSRPGVKNRVVFGDVVSFGKVWRTGANGSTKITFGDDVKVEGKEVKAGTYALYTIPNKDAWKIMLYSDVTLGGNVEEYDATKEVAAFTVKTSKLNDRVETMNINMADMTLKTMNLEIVWENTKVALAISTDIDTKIMKNIESTIVKDNRPFYQAATYYYENDKDMKLATEWVDKAMANNPKAYWIAMLKAKIALKNKDTKGAMAAAELCKTLATEDKDDAYVKQAVKFLADMKK